MCARMINVIESSGSITVGVLLFFKKVLKDHIMINLRKKLHFFLKFLFHISSIRFLFLVVILILLTLSAGFPRYFSSWSEFINLRTWTTNFKHNHHDDEEKKTNLAVTARSDIAFSTITIPFVEPIATNQPNTASRTIVVNSTTYQFLIKDQLQNDTAAHLHDVIKAKASEHLAKTRYQQKQEYFKYMSKYVKIRKERLDLFTKESVKLMKKQTTGIIIVTNYRSGSTFLGELFNQHPDSFYIFEPLLPFIHDYNNESQKKFPLLLKLLKCDFPEIEDIYSQVEYLGDLNQRLEDKNCFLNNFCFRHKVKELCEEKFGKFCTVNRWKNCKPLSLPQVMNACRAKQMTVIKVIRLCDVMSLQSIMADATMNLKIIHLVRDPRGIMSSRLKIHNDLELRSSAEETCARLLHNGQVGLANTSETKWLQDKYLKVRYEDLSLNPIKVAKKVYKFSGLKFLPEIQSWIFNNTKASVSSDPLDPHSTKRNSASVMEAWREHLKFKDVAIVQDICKNMMTFFGYLPATSQAELLNFNVTVIR